MRSSSVGKRRLDNGIRGNGSMRVIGLNIEVRLASSDEESDDVGGSLWAHR